VKPGSWGGHAVYVAAYDEEGLTCITWGAPLKRTWDFFVSYCEQAWIVFSRNDWLNPDGIAPSGYDLNTLRDFIPAGPGAPAIA
jgi:hypothetical protein